MRTHLEMSLIALMEGQKSTAMAVLNQDQIEEMFAIGRSYGFKTVFILEFGHTIQQVATNESNSDAFEIMLSYINSNQAGVLVKRISNPEERIKELSEYTH